MRRAGVAAPSASDTQFGLKPGELAAILIADNGYGSFGAYLCTDAAVCAVDIQPAVICADTCAADSHMMFLVRSEWFESFCRADFGASHAIETAVCPVKIHHRGECVADSELFSRGCNDFGRACGDAGSATCAAAEKVFA